MKHYILPYLSKTEKSDLKIVTIGGHVFYVHDVLPEYRHDERMAVIKNIANYFVSVDNPPPEQDAYFVLVWHLFEDFLNAYEVDWYFLKKPKRKKKKYLYVLENSNGFIKVGVSSNVNIRLVDLKYEFEGDFTVLKVYPSMGYMESKVHDKLRDYIRPVNKRYGGVSQECFENCEEVRSICLSLSSLVQ